MEFRKVEYFLKAAETLNFSEAAKQLYISPQALTQQIVQLETEIGGKLFERNTRNVKVTELGSFCYQQMKPVKTQYDEAIEKIRKKVMESRNVLRIGFFNELPKKDILNPLLELIQNCFPECELDLIALDMNRLWKMLDEGTIDLMVSIVDDFFPTAEYDRVCLQRAEAKVVISEKHRWASQDSVTYADMKEEDMLQFQKGSYKADKNNFYGEVKCRKIHRVTDFDSMLALLESGKYFAVFPRIFNSADYLKLIYQDMPKEYAFTNYAVCVTKKTAKNSQLHEIMKQIKKNWN